MSPELDGARALLGALFNLKDGDVPPAAWKILGELGARLLAGAADHVYRGRGDDQQPYVLVGSNSDRLVIVRCQATQSFQPETPDGSEMVTGQLYRWKAFTGVSVSGTAMALATSHPLRPENYAAADHIEWTLLLGNGLSVTLPRPVLEKGKAPTSFDDLVASLPARLV